MYELGAPGMQADTPVLVRTLEAIFQIAFDRAPDSRQLTTNLVMPACFQVDLQKMIAIRTRDQLITQYRFLRVRPFGIISVGGRFLTIAQ